MTEWVVAQLGPWAWHVLGLVLLGLEILVPGTFFLWFGVSALVVGTLSFFVDLPWQADLLIFIVLALACVVIGRRIMSGREKSEGDAGLNNRGQRYVGRRFVLREAVAEGTGRLSIDDTVWRVHGPDLAAGTEVVVTAVNGSSLVVEPALKA